VCSFVRLRFPVGYNFVCCVTATSYSVDNILKYKANIDLDLVSISKSRPILLAIKSNDCCVCSKNISPS